MPEAPCTSTGTPLDRAVPAEGRRPGVNVSQAAEHARRWRDESRGAIADDNALIAAEGERLAAFRKF